MVLLIPLASEDDPSEPLESPEIKVPEIDVENDQHNEPEESLLEDEEIIEGLREETPLMRIGTVDDIANCALFLASDKSDFITGQVISPNGGFVI